MQSTATAILHEGVTLNEAHIELNSDDGRYMVIWMGWWYGGTFRHEADAYLLKDWCLAQTDEDALGWVEMVSGANR